MVPWCHPLLPVALPPALGSAKNVATAASREPTPPVRRRPTEKWRVGCTLYSATDSLLCTFPLANTAGARRAPSRGSAGMAASTAAYAPRRAAGISAGGTWGNVLRFLPPLDIPDALLDEALDVLTAIFEEAR